MRNRLATGISTFSVMLRSKDFFNYLSHIVELSGWHYLNFFLGILTVLFGNGFDQGSSTCEPASYRGITILRLGHNARSK